MRVIHELQWLSRDKDGKYHGFQREYKAGGSREKEWLWPISVPEHESVFNKEKQ